MNSSSSPWRSLWEELSDTVDEASGEFTSINPDAARLAKRFAAITLQSKQELVTEIQYHNVIGLCRDLSSKPAFSRALDIHFAAFALECLTDWQDRLGLLDWALVERLANDRVLKYLREVTSAFLFGFDLASIALCRAALEQVIKELLVEKGHYTWDEIQRSRVELGRRIEFGESAKLLPPSPFASIDRLLDAGNTVMHQRPYDDKIRRRKAADCIAALTNVVSELYA